LLVETPLNRLQSVDYLVVSGCRMNEVVDSPKNESTFSSAPYHLVTVVISQVDLQCGDGGPTFTLTYSNRHRPLTAVTLKPNTTSLETQHGVPVSKCLLKGSIYQLARIREPQDESKGLRIQSADPGEAHRSTYRSVSVTAHGASRWVPYGGDRVVHATCSGAVVDHPVPPNLSYLSRSLTSDPDAKCQREMGASVVS